MSPSLDVITAQALALPPEQRIELAQRIWSSVENQYGEDDELFAEIARRDAEIESGATKPMPFSQAMREIRDSLQ
ncbi:MAG: addiction module protein [Planctomycetes bacterium]|nr:addiction module protein [Planctomycetota bacterium]